MAKKTQLEESLPCNSAQGCRCWMEACVKGELWHFFQQSSYKMKSSNFCVSCLLVSSIHCRMVWVNCHCVAWFLRPTSLYGKLPHWCFSDQCRWCSYVIFFVNPSTGSLQALIGVAGVSRGLPSHTTSWNYSCFWKNYQLYTFCSRPGMIPHLIQPLFESGFFWTPSPKKPAPPH